MPRIKPISALLILLLLVGCSGSASGPNGQPTAIAANAIRVLVAYSPEKEAWLQERFTAFNATQPMLNGRPVVAEGVNKSSGAARTELVQNQLDATVWSPSSSAWLEVLKTESNNPDAAVSAAPLVLTPVVISMWKPMAEALGWPNKPIGWNDLLQLTQDPEGWGKFGHGEWGKFSWGHTDPEISTTALSTVLAEAYTANNKVRGLTTGDIEGPQTQQFLSQLSQSIKHYGYNTLVFSDNMQKYGMSYISAFPMEEITLIDFNKKAPATPLVAIYPREGTFFHDNPFIILSKAPSEQQQAAKLLYDFLLTADSQNGAIQFGFRPANPSVPFSAGANATFGVDPDQPAASLEMPAGDVLVAAKRAWANNRKRADIILLVDTSGSMEGDKMEQAKAGLQLFLSRLLPEDRVALVTFDDSARVNVPLGVLRENRQALDGAVTDLRARGSTALYDGLNEALKLARDSTEARDRIQAVVLLSDGADRSSSMSFDQVKQQFDESGITIFPVAYGDDAEEQVLQQIADFGRGLLVKGGSSDINRVFENLSRYF